MEQASREPPPGLHAATSVSIRQHPEGWNKLRARADRAPVSMKQTSVSL